MNGRAAQKVPAVVFLVAIAALSVAPFVAIMIPTAPVVTLRSALEEQASGPIRSEDLAEANARAIAAEERRIELVARLVVSIAVLGAALYVILSDRFPDAQSKWAFGAVGTVLGYWLG